MSVITNTGAIYRILGHSSGSIWAAYFISSSCFLKVSIYSLFIKTNIGSYVLQRKCQKINEWFTLFQGTFFANKALHWVNLKLFLKHSNSSCGISSNIYNKEPDSCSVDMLFFEVDISTDFIESKGYICYDILKLTKSWC